MSTDVIFEKGVSLNALDAMEQDMRELEKRDFIRTWGTVREGLISGVFYSDTVVTATLDGKVMGIFGVVKDEVEGPRPWLALSRHAMEHRAKVVRFMKAWVHVYLEKYGHLSNAVPAEDTQAIDLLEVAGFNIDRTTLHYRADEQYFVFEASLGGA